MPKVNKPAATPAPAPATAMTAPAPAAPAAGMPPPPPRVASANPDSYVSTGLANNFNGTVVQIHFLPRKHGAGKKKDTYGLFAEVSIKADDESLGDNGIVREYYGVASLNQWVPWAGEAHPDGNGNWNYAPAGADLETYKKLHEGTTGFAVINPATGQAVEGELAVMPPDTFRGFMALPGAQNSMSGFGKGTKWQQFTEAVKALGYASMAPNVNWADMREFMIGVKAHWTRLPFEFKGGAPEGAQKIDTLCPTEILSVPGAGQVAAVAVSAPAVQAQATVTAAPSVTTATAPTAAPGSNNLEDVVNRILSEIVNSAGAAGISKNDVSGQLFARMGAMGMTADAAKGLVLLNDGNWMVGDDRGFAYDPETGTLLPLS